MFLVIVLLFLVHAIILMTLPKWVSFLFVPDSMSNSPGAASAEYVSTWLGEPMAARGACNTAMGERPGESAASCGRNEADDKHLGALTLELSICWAFFISN